MAESSGILVLLTDAERAYMLGKEQLQKFCKFEMLAKLEVVVTAKAAAATAKKKKHNVALDCFGDHPCVKGIVKENQKGKILYNQDGIMKVVQEKLLNMNVYVTDINRIIVYAVVCGVFAYSSDETIRISGFTCFISNKIQTINKNET